MVSGAVSPVLTSTVLWDANPRTTPHRIEAAAREFEAMLIAQLLKVSREAGKLDAGEDEMTGGEGYLELAEQQLAKTLAATGVLGFTRLLLRDLDGLEKRVAESPVESSQTEQTEQ